MSGIITGLDADIVKKYQGIASKGVVHAVARASQRTGVDFSFLMEKASTESSFNPNAKSKTSSATGLFQFIESTWLSMVKEHGAKYGLAKLADHIEIKNGRPCVDNCAIRKQILSLRHNPEISALMAGEFSSENKDYLQTHTSSPVGSTELYLAHFLGAQSAARFINGLQDKPDATAARLLPQAARANHSVFYTSSGRARSLQEVYQLFDRKFSDTDRETADTTTPPTPSTQTVSAFTASAPVSPSGTFPPQDDPIPAQTLPSFSDDDGRNKARRKKDEIIWSDDPRYAQFTAQLQHVSRKGNVVAGSGALTPAAMLTIAEMANPTPAFVQNGQRGSSAHSYGFNS